MFTLFQPFEGLNSFVEKRLLFREPNPNSLNNLRSRRKPRDPNDPPPNPDKILKRTNEQLARLKAQQSGSAPRREPERATTRTPGATRELTPPPVYHPESPKIYERNRETRGLMNSTEVQMMQGVHQKLYEHYINPAFILYLKQIGKSDVVYAAMDKVLKNPEMFMYVNKGHDTLEIIKRPPHSSANAQIPDKFKIVMKGSAGHIAGIQPDNDGGHYVDLLTRSGDVAWASNNAYNAEMPRYRLRWSSELDRYEMVQGNDKSDEVVIQESIDSASETMKRIFVMENYDFPKRVLNIMRARNLKDAQSETGSWELRDPRVVDFIAHFNRQGKTYEELTRNNMQGTQLMVDADSNAPGVYIIQTRAAVQARPRVYLRVNENGYILNWDGHGHWVPDPRYNKAVMRKYYADHPAAWNALPPTERSDLERSGARVEADRHAREVAERERAERERVARNRQTVDDALTNATLDQLKAVAKAIAPDREGDADIDAVTDPGDLLPGIQTLLNGNPGRLQTVAGILGLHLD